MKVIKYRILDFTKSNLLIVFCIPVFFNSLLNILETPNLKIFNEISFAKFESFILGSLFFIFLSNFLNIS